MAPSKFPESLDKTSDIIMCASGEESLPATETGKEAESKIEEGAKTSLATLSLVESDAKDVKWRAACTIVTDIPTEMLWAVAEDFCNLEWFTMVTACVLLEGEGSGNSAGSVRHCTNEMAPIPWFSDERLVAIDHEKLTLTYEMVNSSFGWLNYRATLSVGQHRDGKNFVELKGEQSSADGMTEEENVKFMNTAYNIFLTDLESKARTLQFSNAS